MEGNIDVSGGHLADHTQELYHRASFLELFILLLSSYPDMDGVVNEDNLTGFYFTARDLTLLTRAINERANSEA